LANSLSTRSDLVVNSNASWEINGPQIGKDYVWQVKAGNYSDNEVTIEVKRTFEDWWRGLLQW